MYRGKSACVEDLARRIQGSAGVPIPFGHAYDAELHVVRHARVSAELLDDVLVLGRDARIDDARRIFVASATRAARRLRKTGLEEPKPVENFGRVPRIFRGAAGRASVRGITGAGGAAAVAGCATAGARTSR
jgi:hypothetical protein